MANRIVISADDIKVQAAENPAGKFVAPAISLEGFSASVTLRMVSHTGLAYATLDGQQASMLMEALKVLLRTVDKR